jgi:hypothetical protein
MKPLALSVEPVTYHAYECELILALVLFHVEQQDTCA